MLKSLLNVLDCSFYQVENSVHKSNCIMTLLECGRDSTVNNMLLEMLAQIIREPCFNVLRTKEQLGYIVFSGVRKTGGVYSLTILVQSDRKPAYLDSRIENFIKSARSLIKVCSAIQRTLPCCF